MIIGLMQGSICRGTISSPVIARGVAAAGVVGFAPAELCARLGIAASTLQDVEARVPIQVQFALLELFARRLADPALPVRIATLARVEDHDLFGFLVLSSTSGREALQRVVRYGALISDSGAWAVAFDADAVRVRWRREGPRTLGHRLDNELAAAAFLHGVRLALARPVAAQWVGFRHAAPESTRAHDEFFGATIEWGADADGFDLPPWILDVAPRGASAALGSFLAAQADAALERVPLSDDAADQVRRAIEQELPDGPPSMARVARRLGCSERTLRRQLDLGGTGFRALVDGVRRDRAIALLRRGRDPLSQISFVLGFSDQSAFTRAFRRWCGKAPSDFRREEVA
jgi:AraC-like DNA-binding protein